MSMRKRRGFMFIEVLCVLVATGVAAALAAPRLAKTVDRSRLRTAGNLVGNAVGRAKIVAATRGCEAVVHIGSGSDAQVWVTSCKTSGRGIDTLTANQVAAAFRGSVTTTLDSIGFSPAGVRTARERVIIRLVDDEGAVADSVVIDPVGRVKRT
jgi:Tfp pilus assembly protein FimT